MTEFIIVFRETPLEVKQAVRQLAGYLCHPAISQKKPWLKFREQPKVQKKQ